REFHFAWIARPRWRLRPAYRAGSKVLIAWATRKPEDREQKNHVARREQWAASRRPGKTAHWLGKTVRDRDGISALNDLKNLVRFRDSGTAIDRDRDVHRGGGSAHAARE